MTELERTLGAVAARRWPIVLCWPRSKKPAARKDEPWPVTGDADRVGQHVGAGGNAGLVGGARSGVVMLDPDVPEACRQLVERLGEPGPAWVQTGSGRRHYYVQWEPELPAKLISLDGEIIGEIQRGLGEQHCLMPPSIHPDTGRAYRWLVDPAGEPLRPLPETWRAWLHRPRHHVPPGRPARGVPGAGTERDALMAAALAQPGAQRRASGVVKFPCPACRAEGFDTPGALLADGRWGCAWASGTALGRRHWEAIGIALGRLRPAAWRPW